MQVQRLNTALPQTAGILRKFSGTLKGVQSSIQNQTAQSIKRLVSVRV